MRVAWCWTSLSGRWSSPQRTCTCRGQLGIMIPAGSGRIHLCFVSRAAHDALLGLVRNDPSATNASASSGVNVVDGSSHGLLAGPLRPRSSGHPGLRPRVMRVSTSRITRQPKPPVGSGGPGVVSGAQLELELTPRRAKKPSTDCRQCCPVFLRAVPSSDRSLFKCNNDRRFRRQRSEIGLGSLTMLRDLILPCSTGIVRNFPPWKASQVELRGYTVAL